MSCFSIKKPSPETSLIYLYMDFDGLTSCIFSSTLHVFANNSFQTEENSVPVVETLEVSDKRKESASKRQGLSVYTSGHLFNLHSVTVLYLFWRFSSEPRTTYLCDVPLVAKLPHPVNLEQRSSKEQEVVLCREGGEEASVQDAQGCRGVCHN